MADNIPGLSDEEKPGKHGRRWRILARADDGRRFDWRSPEYDEGMREFYEKNPNPHRTQSVVEFSTVFDELVVDGWLHVEQMDDDHWWMKVGDARVEVRLNDEGDADVAVFRNEYNDEGDALAGEVRNRLDALKAAFGTGEYGGYAPPDAARALVAWSNENPMLWALYDAGALADAALKVMDEHFGDETPPGDGRETVKQTFLKLLADYGLGESVKKESP